MNIPITNKTFWRALHSLGHPVTVFAVILLLINDHWLRYETPSWLTGKLGDFVWLIFAPILLAIVLSWLIPRSHSSHERLVGLLSFGLIGLWFATAKTIAPVHSITTQMLDALVGWRGGLLMDVTDLVTLPGLLIGWWVWRSVPDKPNGVFSGTWLVLILGLMGTLATSCPGPEIDRRIGIAMFCRFEDGIYAGTGSYEHASFITSDGGQWQPLYGSRELNDCIQSKSGMRLSDDSFALESPVGRFRFVLGEGIYASYDGQPERRELDLAAQQHDTYERDQEGNGRGLDCRPLKLYAVGPFDAIFDEKTGQVFVAMGVEGILRRSTDGVWAWVTVGDYHRVEPDSISSLVTLLRPEFEWSLLALLLIPPTVATLGSVLRWYGILSLTAGWMAWILYPAFLFLQPGLVIIIFIIGATWHSQLIDHYLFQRRRFFAYFMTMVLSLGTALLFLLPFLLWGRRTVLNYETASNFALMLLVVCMISCRQYINWRFPARKKIKEDDDSENDDVLSNGDDLIEAPVE